MKDIFFGRYYQRTSFADNSLFLVIWCGYLAAIIRAILSIYRLQVFAEVISKKIGVCPYYSILYYSILGLILYTIIMVNWVTTPPDEPITKGIYRYSRHPMYLTPFLVFIGVGIASASWIFLLCSVAFIILPPFFVKPEEHFLLKKYGNSYREYMNKTPRWVGIPKSGGK